MKALIVIGRRFVVVAALMFWLGGFTFYASVVVPTGTRVLRTSLRQGFITRQVTRELNVYAAVALGILAVEVLASGDPSWPRWWSRLGLWLVMAGCQAGLFWLHGRLDSLLVERGRLILDIPTFHQLHRAYLWIHTLQWAAGLGFIVLVLLGWRAADRADARPLARATS
jgi:hypothetical protein